jgi:enamine deaminase RidA (YjgF/YER057c/UK114 family)
MSAEVVRFSPDGDRVPELFGFHQAQLVRGGSRMLFLSGQVGDPAADLAGQVAGAIDRIEVLLVQAGMGLSDLMKLTILTTDVEALVVLWPSVRARFEPGVVPANTLAQVARFAHPSALIEIDAIAIG